MTFDLPPPDHRLGRPPGPDGDASVPAVHQGVAGRRELRQRVHAAAAGNVAAFQALRALRRAAGRLRRLRLLRSARMKVERVFYVCSEVGTIHLIRIKRGNVEH